MVPKKKKTTKSKWMTQEILNQMDERRKVKRDSQKYNHLHRTIQHKCRREKERGQKPEIHKNMEGPKILQSEIRSAVKKMKKNKAPCPDEIVIEMIDALKDFGIQRLTTITNIIYDTGEITDILLKSIFIALPKKTGTTECELHRTISLMSHIMKIILKGLMQRARRCMKPEISTEQFGFVEDSGT
ncbi:uncharacterized protein LOC125039323 [Penaeus chinensis]|uniref:uncharacterized protein LOC125039323 n=1 Tax=Penaeus chinensis TaxID=139456 RepID=UPI001FB6F5A2|nr:uncharacterized protein LOC125039323 [Penaeus chinensis]